ncbi:MAG: hypothetical protein GXO23_00205 [Crenarchaeota archaeon]|nr:hypothetical protein [Thermoproteota archaeon]
MSEVDQIGRIGKMIEELKRTLEDMNRRTNIINEDFASAIARFVNTLWTSLKVPEDVKIRLLEMTLDYVLRAALRVRYPSRTSCNDSDLPREYVI